MRRDPALDLYIEEALVWCSFSGADRPTFPPSTSPFPVAIRPVFLVGDAAEWLDKRNASL